MSLCTLFFSPFSYGVIVAVSHISVDISRGYVRRLVFLYSIKKLQAHKPLALLLPLAKLEDDRRVRLKTNINNVTSRLYCGMLQP